MQLDEFVHKLATEGKNFASVATVMPDGSPQVSIVWVDSDGENIILNTAEGRLKTNNLRKDGRVAIAIMDADNPYKIAMIRGKVIEETHEDADSHIDKMSNKYLGEDYPHRQPGEVRVVFKIKPEKVLKLDF